MSYQNAIIIFTVIGWPIVSSLLVWIRHCLTFMFVTVFVLLSATVHSLTLCTVGRAQNNRSRRLNTIPLYKSHHQRPITTMLSSLISSTLKSYRIQTLNPDSTISTRMSRPRTIMKSLIALLCTPNYRQLGSNEVKYFVILVNIFACNEFVVTKVLFSSAG